MSHNSDGLYTLININVHVQFTLYVHWITSIHTSSCVSIMYASVPSLDPSTTKPIYYKVRAVDYWSQSGEYSDVACVLC